MERQKIVSRVLLIGGVTLAGAFDSVARSESAPPDSGDCRITQTRGNEVIVVCPYPYRPEADIKRVQEACIITGAEIYGHRTLMRARLNTDLQKNCWGPPLKDYIKTVIKNPPKIPLHRRP